jgi:hypothetical protein
MAVDEDVLGAKQIEGYGRNIGSFKKCMGSFFSISVAI